MFIIQKIETMHLSSSQSEVARYLLDKKLEIENKTIYELARETYTSSHNCSFSKEIRI